MRYFLHLSYFGKKFHGWQNQKDVTTVQEVLEQHLSQLLKTPTTCHGCGRTDAGVHASQYFCNINIAKEIDFDFIFRINKILPPSIVVYGLIPVADNANTQYDATRRTYDYYFHFKENPFLHELSSFFDVKDLDFSTIKKSVKLLLGKKDFRGFCKNPDGHNTTICNVTNVQLFVNEAEDRMQFQISANRFLRGMIRFLAMHLIRIGMGKMTLAEFEHSINSGERSSYFHQAPPQGLYLSKIEYPYLDIPPRKELLTIESK